MITSQAKDTFPAEIVYGVFDETNFTFHEKSAEADFEDLSDALSFVADDIEDGIAKRFCIYLCKYDKKREGYFPIPNTSCIDIDAREFESIEDFRKED